MKLKDILEKEERVLYDIIYHLRQTKKNLMTYTKLSSQEYDGMLDDIREKFYESRFLDTDGENKLYGMMSQIDSWILSLRRIHLDKGKEKKDWFSDDEVEVKKVYHIDDDGENTDGGK